MSARESSESPSGQASAHAAAEEHDLEAVLHDVCSEAKQAAACWQARDPALARPLVVVTKVLDDYAVEVRCLGEQGFDVDHAAKRITFNETILRGVARTVEILFGQGELAPDELQQLIRTGVSLYVFHEIGHVVQNFTKHELAAMIKDAFGADELSKIDLVADVEAAHCAALVSQAAEDDFGLEAYLRVYQGLLLLSYQILVSAFVIKDADHKKKRALGLLTGYALAQRAIDTFPEMCREAISLAVRPAFTSVDTALSSIVALSCGDKGWTILFHGRAGTNRLSVAGMWDALGTPDPTDIIGLLRLAQAQHLDRH